MRNDMEKAALVVVDVQNDFCLGGALAVPDGDGIVAGINGLMAERGVVVLTQDWHPRDHMSFASNHGEGVEPFTEIVTPHGRQTLWPDHCVQGTRGAEFHPGLETDRARMAIRKGTDPGMDSYSGFFENGRRTPTGLCGFLHELGVERVEIVGLATDFCVKWTALDARILEFGASVRLDLCRAIDSDGSLDRALDEMRAAGVDLAE